MAPQAVSAAGGQRRPLQVWAEVVVASLALEAMGPLAEAPVHKVEAPMQWLRLPTWRPRQQSLKLSLQMPRP